MSAGLFSETILLVVLTCVVSWAGFHNPRVIQALLLWPPAIERKSEFYRLATYGVVHADLPHLAFNMITLFFFGRVMEDFYRHEFGQLGFVLFYVLALVVSILPTYLQHRRDPHYRSLGASGAVSAVLFAYVLFAPWQIMYVMFIPVPSIVYAVFYVGYSIWSQGKGEDNVNHSAHLWGAAFGVVFTLVVEPKVGLLFLSRLMSPLG
jgi:membrane associated rhomboid family serine protease